MRASLYLNKETASLKMRSFVFALPIFTARAIYRHAVVSVRWTLTGIKKTTLSDRLLVFALRVFMVRATILCR